MTRAVWGLLVIITTWLDYLRLIPREKVPQRPTMHVILMGIGLLLTAWTTVRAWQSMAIDALLVDHPKILPILEAVLGETIILGSLNARIVRPDAPPSKVYTATSAKTCSTWPRP